jgi:hypothetical protein
MRRLPLFLAALFAGTVGLTSFEATALAQQPAPAAAQAAPAQQGTPAKGKKAKGKKAAKAKKGKAAPAKQAPKAQRTVPAKRKH